MISPIDKLLLTRGFLEDIVETPCRSPRGKLTPGGGSLPVSPKVPRSVVMSVPVTHKGSKLNKLIVETPFATFEVG